MKCAALFHPQIYIHKYIIYTRIIISMVHSHLFSCFFFFIRPNNENESHSAIDNCNQTATEKDWNAKSTFAYLQRWIVGIFVIFLLFFWYFYDLYRKNGMKTDAHTHTYTNIPNKAFDELQTKYNDIATAAKSKRKKDKQQMLRTWYEYDKLLNLANILVQYHRNCIWCTKGITGWCCYSVLCVYHRLLIFFPSLLCLGFHTFFTFIFLNVVSQWALNVNHLQPQKDKPLCRNVGI